MLRKIIEETYRKIPESKVKVLLRNSISFTLHTFSLRKETVNINGEPIQVYKVPVYDNHHLAEEVSGYNKYYKLQKGDIVVDAGGYSGFFTMYAGKKVGSTGKVIVFEPDPFNYTLLKKNIRLNKIRNAIVINKGLYSTNTTLPFDIQGIGSTLVIKKGRKTNHAVPVVSLDNELERLRIKKVNFIKMDIEGGEIEAVKGCLRTIKNNKALHFAIASYHVVNGKKTSIFLEQFFKKIRMKVKTLQTEHPTTYAWKE